MWSRPRRRRPGWRPRARRLVDGVGRRVVVGREQVRGRRDVGLDVGEAARARGEPEASMLSRRPLMSTCLPLKRTKLWTSSRNLSMSKKLPVKRKVNGMVGKPAEPTVAPGGSVAAAAWVAGAGVVVDGVELVELDAPPVPEDGAVGRRRGGGRRCWWARGPGRRRPRPSASGSRCGRCATRPAAGRPARAAHRSWARPCRASRCPRSPRCSGPWPSRPATPSAARRSAAGWRPGSASAGSRTPCAWARGPGTRSRPGGRDEHGDDDEAIASGHGVFAAGPRWRRTAMAKKRVIENCG